MASPFCAEPRRVCALASAELDAFIDRLIDVVEKRKLAFGGGRDDKLDGLVTRMGRGSATEDDRVALVVFLAGDDAVVRHEVGVLRDAWYGWTERVGSADVASPGPQG